MNGWLGLIIEAQHQILFRIQQLAGGSDTLAMPTKVDLHQPDIDGLPVLSAVSLQCSKGVLPGDRIVRFLRSAQRPGPGTDCAAPPIPGGFDERNGVEQRGRKAILMTCLVKQRVIQVQRLAACREVKCYHHEGGLEQKAMWLSVHRKTLALPHFENHLDENVSNRYLFFNRAID